MPSQSTQRSRIVCSPPVISDGHSVQASFRFLGPIEAEPEQKVLVELHPDRVVRVDAGGEQPIVLFRFHEAPRPPQPFTILRETGHLAPKAPDDRPGLLVEGHQAIDHRPVVDGVSVVVRDPAGPDLPVVCRSGAASGSGAETGRRRPGPPPRSGAGQPEPLVGLGPARGREHEHRPAPDREPRVHQPVAPLRPVRRRPPHPQLVQHDIVVAHRSLIHTVKVRTPGPGGCR